MRVPFVLLLAVLLVPLCLFAPGCRRKPRPPSAPTPEEQQAAAQRLMSELNQVLQSAEAALAEGRTNGVFNGIEAALTDARFAAYRAELFDRLLRLMIRAGDLDAVRQRALRACDDPVLAEGAGSTVYNHYRDSGDAAGREAWSAELLALPRLPATVRRAAFDWNIADNIALDRDAAALSALGESLRVLAPPEAAGLTEHAVAAFFDAGRHDSVEQALAVAARLQPAPPAITHLATATRVRLRIARGEWPALTNDFAAAAASLPDDALARLLRTVGAAMQKAGRRPLLDACAETVLFAPSARSNASATTVAASLWVENAFAADTATVPVRIDALLRAQIPAGQVVPLFLRYFYKFSEDAVTLQALLPVGERLAPLAPDAETRNEIRTRLLDGCFLVKDYDRAIAMLEAGVPGPGHDEQWHKTAIVKLKAHRALERREPREAVQHFREFMKLLEASKDTEMPDPVTSATYPKEMVLGRNARRIGDILAAIPDAAAAAAAYEEARGLYAQALEKARDAGARKVIEVERSQVPPR
jgi:tetratricopeptide (TPR) repeat protein